MGDGMRIAVSGMQAAATQLSAAASNIVNQNSAGPVPATPPSQPVAQNPGSVYQPLAVSQNPVPGGGVSASLQASLPSYYLAYSPDAPYANLQGMVAMPDTDLAANIVSMSQAAFNFGASLKVFQASSHMFSTMLDTVA
jgi:flagellar basal-body rod protein FlgC